jgi:hypothetical protein
MALKILAASFMTAAATPLAATNPEPVPPVAPAGTPETRYCMRIEITGSRIDIVRCWTREEWAEQEVDVDKEWAENGVRIVG